MANTPEQDALLEDLAANLSISDSDDSSGVVRGGADNDTLIGDSNDNRIDAFAFTGINTVLGAAGNDRIEGGSGDETLNGGVDDDEIFGKKGDDILNGGAGNDQLAGGGGRDLLRGHDGNDILNGGGGADRLLGGKGADTLIGNVGNDVINGGDGIDTAEYFGEASEYTVALTEGGLSVTKTSGLGPNEGVDTLTNVEILQFSDSRVLVVGSGGFETIQEAVDVAQDGDTIQIAAGTYTEQVFITNKEGLSIIGAGEGTVIKAPASLQVNEAGLPGVGSKVVDAAGVVSVLGSRDISIEGLTIDGDDAGDAIVTGGTPYFAGLLFVDSSGGADDLTITNVREPLEGGLPANGRNGDGVAIYNTDTLSRTVSIENTTVETFQKTGIRANGEDLTVSLDGNVITGAGLLSAADALTQIGVTIENGAGGEVTGNTIANIGTLRNDIPTVGVFVDEAADGVSVTGNTFTGVGSPNSHTGVIIDGDVSNAVVTGNAFNGILNGVAALNDVDGTEIADNTFDNMIDELPGVVGGARPGLFTAVSASDNQFGLRYNGTEGADLVEGSSETDRVRTGGGDDFAAGDGGDDRLVMGGGNDTALGGVGDDRLNGNGGDDLLEGGAGADILRGGGGNDELRGASGEDDLNGGGGQDRVFGGGGSDDLNGGGGDDDVRGGAGDDTINGGAGDDILRGNNGDDTFVFDADDAGDNVVRDYEAGETVQLNGFGFADEADAATAFVQVGTDTVFSGGDVTVTFADTSRADVVNGIELGSSGATTSASQIARIDAGHATGSSDVFESLLVEIDDAFMDVA